MGTEHGKIVWLGPSLARRDVLRMMIGGAAISPAWGAQTPPSTTPGASRPEDPGLQTVRDRLLELKIEPLASVRSAHFTAIGDAAEGFMRVILDDCEQLAQDYLRHFRDRGFEVQLPDHPLIVVMFRDDRSFGKFFHLPSLLEAAASGRPVQPAGVYDWKSNLLHVFDWRNVPVAPRAAHRNMETLAHEGTHQLCFNTGLLRRGGDIPLCLVEGLGTYGEARRTSGHCELGRLNLKRLEDLAKIQRRMPWITVRVLLKEDAALRTGNSDRVLLGYAESWLLVHYLMQDPKALPGFRDYLRAIGPRDQPDRRLEDAQAHLGDLDSLDRELRRYQVRLQHSLR